MIIPPNSYGKNEHNVKSRMSAHSTTTMVFIAYVGEMAALAII